MLNQPPRVIYPLEHSPNLSQNEFYVYLVPQLLPFQQYIQLEGHFPLRYFYYYFRFNILIFWYHSNFHSWFTTWWSTPIIFFRDIIMIFHCCTLCHLWNTTSWKRDTFLFNNFYWLFSLPINCFGDTEVSVATTPIWDIVTVVSVHAPRKRNSTYI